MTLIEDACRSSSRTSDRYPCYLLYADRTTPFSAADSGCWPIDIDVDRLRKMLTLASRVKSIFLRSKVSDDSRHHAKSMNSNIYAQKSSWDVASIPIGAHGDQKYWLRQSTDTTTRDMDIVAGASRGASRQLMLTHFVVFSGMNATDLFIGRKSMGLNVNQQICMRLPSPD